MKKYILFVFITLLSSTLFAQVQITCDDVVVATEPLEETNYVEVIEKRSGGCMEACEINLRNDNLVATEIHPFVETVHKAYADHRPLTLSPDMIWLLICQGFSKHVDYNAEELRDKFVDFEGKKKLIVHTEHLSMDFKKGSPDSPWKLAFPAFSDSIKTYVGAGLHDLYIQSFTTTTPIEKAAFEVSLMDGMDSYFEYEMRTSCGIPTITLEGTPEDWLKIKTDLQKFRGYGIDNWITGLEPVVEEFVLASNNKINKEFWSEIYKRRGGSGGPYIQGWIIKFFPYLKTTSKEPKMNPYLEKKPEGSFGGLTTDSFFNGLSKAEFVWNYYGKEYKMEFLAGFVGIRQNKETMELRPEIGWVVKDRMKKKKKKSMWGK